MSFSACQIFGESTEPPRFVEFLGFRNFRLRLGHHSTRAPNAIGPASYRRDISGSNSLRSDFFRERLDFGRRKHRHFRHKARFGSFLKTLARLQIEVERRTNQVCAMDFQDQTRIGPCERRACFPEIEAKIAVEIGADIDRVCVRRPPGIELRAGKATR